MSIARRPTSTCCFHKDHLRAAKGIAFTCAQMPCQHHLRVCACMTAFSSSAKALQYAAVSAAYIADHGSHLLHRDQSRGGMKRSK